MPRKYIWVLVVLLVATTLAAVYEYYNEQYRSECSPLQSCREQKTYTKVWYDADNGKVVGDAGNLWYRSSGYWATQIKMYAHPYARNCLYDSVLKKYTFYRIDYDRIDWVFYTLVSTWETMSGVTVYPKVC